MRGHKQRKIPHISYNDVETLLQRRVEEAPKPGDYLYDYKLEVLKKEIETMNEDEIKKKVKIKFTDLPISRLTQNGLKKRNFKVMTEIQRCVLPHALADRDILGASKTGSGKTLSYLLPVIEKLYTQKFNPLDGLGALIILPTRELALQVFEVLASITSDHAHLSMGLIIGGKNVKYEKEKIERMNILIATPGRLLQHMDESPGFDASNLKILVLDEVDMLLELGFANTLEGILQNLGKERQTLLFSATLTKEIHNLAKLSLKKPEYISLHESRVAKAADGTTTEEKIPMQYEVPKGLAQYYMQIKIEDKLDTLFSFLRTHTKTKSLVFFSSIKQVRFAYEAFRKLNLSRALPLFELHGKQKQPQRMAIFFGFKEKKHASMFTTNIAARGLDFPSVDWVIQVDCPEDVATYVHRVGRTARYKSGGKSLLLLAPTEEKFIGKLKNKGISLNRIYPNPNKALTIKSSLQSFLTEDMNLKHLAQKAFISYVRGVHLMPDKEVFDVKKVDTDSFAESLGLISAPVLKFVTKEEIEEEEEEPLEEQKTGEKKKKKSKLAKLKEKIKQKREEKLQKQATEKEDEEEEEEEGDDEEEEEEEEEEKPATVPVKASGKRPAKVDLEAEDDFLTIKRRDHEISLENQGPIELKASKNQLKKIKDEGHFGGRNRTIYDEDGNAFTPSELKAKQIAEYTKEGEKRKDEPVLNYIKRKIMNEEQDKEREKERVREKKLKRKLKMKAADQEKAGGERIAVLGSPGSYDEEEEGDYDEEGDFDEDGQEDYDEEEDFEEEDME